MKDNKDNDTSAHQSLLDLMQDALAIKLKELGKLVESHKSSKTKTKRDYLQKKINAKRDQVLQYMLEVDKVRNSDTRGEH